MQPTASSARAAQQSLAATRFDAETARLTLVTGLANAYFNVLSVRDRLRIHETRSNVLEIESGRLTGRMVDQSWGDICDGAEKRRAVLQAISASEYPCSRRIAAPCSPLDGDTARAEPVSNAGKPITFVIGMGVGTCG